MQLIDFNIHNPDIDIQGTSVFLIHSKKYSPLLLHRSALYLQKALKLELKKIDIDQEFVDIQRQLQTTFLGQTFLYWIPDLSGIASKKKRSDLLNYITSYQGPHRLVACVTEPQEIHSSNVLTIDVQDQYTSDQVVKLTMLYDDQTEHTSSSVKPEAIAYFIGKLYRQRKQYSAEQLCFLLGYAGVLGKNTDHFFSSWLDQLVISDVSLYWLSQLFFEKKAADFFEVWSEVRSWYSDQFWTSFFSEQLFKAYWVVALQGRIGPEHKAITFGLPFSFLKHDWKLHKKAFLAQFHQKIYQVDLLLKSGATVSRLDLFLVQFFQGL